jgi:F-type H+-transporting ATPase subunit c
MLGAGLAAGLAGLGAAIGNAIIFSSYFKSVSRQPGCQKMLDSKLFVGVAFVEGLAVISIVIAFILANK